MQVHALPPDHTEPAVAVQHQPSDRGLDIFQWFESSAFNAATNLQEARLTKGCEVSFIRIAKEG